LSAAHFRKAACVPEINVLFVDAAHQPKHLVAPPLPDRLIVGSSDPTHPICEQLVVTQLVKLSLSHNARPFSCPHSPRGLGPSSSSRSTTGFDTPHRRDRPCQRGLARTCLVPVRNTHAIVVHTLDRARRYSSSRAVNRSRSFASSTTRRPRSVRRSRYSLSPSRVAGLDALCRLLRFCFPRNKLPCSFDGCRRSPSRGSLTYSSSWPPHDGPATSSDLRRFGGRPFIDASSALP
jgi:hypothetical protein